MKIDGFLLPGHVSAIIGSKPYKFIKVPAVITGFEPNDILEGIFLLLKQINLKKTGDRNTIQKDCQRTGKSICHKIAL